LLFELVEAVSWKNCLHFENMVTARQQCRNIIIHFIDTFKEYGMNQIQDVAL
jgi:hypothetical protein